MKRNTLNYVVDVASLLLMFALTATGIVLHYVMPRGGAGRFAGRARLWDLSRHEWGDLHFYMGLAAVALLLVHVVLHWTWVCTVTRRLLRPGHHDAPLASWQRSIYGWATVGVVAIGLGLFTLAAYNSVEQLPPAGRAAGHISRPDRPGDGRGPHRHGRAAAVPGRSAPLAAFPADTDDH